MYKKENYLRKSKRVIVKIGSGILTNSSGDLNVRKINALIKHFLNLIKMKKEVIIVSSGAIAAGRKKLGLSEKPKTIPLKQAAAAIGQSSLMKAYERGFDRYGVKVAQILLTNDDLSNRKRFLNARTTILTLLSFGIVPVINENDTVATDEIKFGDNDTLSSQIVNLVEADLLLILSDVNGLYDKDPNLFKDAQLIPEVREITSEIEKLGGGTKSSLSVGGMHTKILAARRSAASGATTVIINGNKETSVKRFLEGEIDGTVFFPKERPVKSKKFWIAFTLKPKGFIKVDEGAKKALIKGGKSLLPSGIKDVRGKFSSGNAVAIVDESEAEFARGIVKYSSSEIEKIKGLRSNEIEKKLGHKLYDEIIHRDDLVILQ